MFKIKLLQIPTELSEWIGEKSLGDYLVYLYLHTHNKQLWKLLTQSIEMAPAWPVAALHPIPTSLPTNPASSTKQFT